MIRETPPMAIDGASERRGGWRAARRSPNYPTNQQPAQAARLIEGGAS